MYFNLEILNFSIILILSFICVASSTQFGLYDYIIVGSGAAGSVIANRLSKDPSNEVLLYETGKRPPLLAEVPGMAEKMLVTEYTWKFTAVRNPTYGFGLNDQRVLIESGKMLGGSGQMNYNLYIRGHRRDFDNWGANGAVGWGWNNVFPYFVKLEGNRNLEIAVNGFHGVGGDLVVQFPPFHTPITKAYNGAAKSLGYVIDDFNGLHQNVFMPPQGTVKDGRRWSTLQAFINPILGRRNLKILTSAFVIKILIDGNNRAYGVAYEHDGKLKEAFAKKEVIISAGKLLMLSGIGPKEELERLQISVLMDLPVGKNLHDHVTTLLNAFLVDTFTFRNDRIPNNANAEFLTNGTGVLTSLGAVEIIGFINSRHNEYPQKPDVEIVWLTSSMASDNGTVLRIASNINDKIWRHFEPFVNYDTVTCVPTNPKSRGYVTLRSSNPHDEPIVDLNFYSHPHDLKVMIEGMKFCLEMSMTKPMQKLKARPFPNIVPGCEAYEQFSDGYLGCMALVQPFSLYHPVGTCKMGDINDPSTVVDPTLKVKGITGLRVVDALIIPSLPAGHTFTIITMVAEKAADIILHEKHVFN